MTREDIIRMVREAHRELVRQDYPGQLGQLDFWTMRLLERVAALAAEQPKHPGYVIGSHWLETAYSRICAGEAEADVLRDCGWERVDDAEALRRDAERYRYLRNRDPKEVFDKSGKAAGVWIDWEDDLSGLQLLTGDDADAAIDAAMGEKR